MIRDNFDCGRVFNNRKAIVYIFSTMSSSLNSWRFEPRSDKMVSRTFKGDCNPGDYYVLYESAL